MNRFANLDSNPTREEVKDWPNCALCGVLAPKLMGTVCGDSCKSSCYSYWSKNGNAEQQQWAKNQQLQSQQVLGTVIYIRKSWPIPS